MIYQVFCCVQLLLFVLGCSRDVEIKPVSPGQPGERNADRGGDDKDDYDGDDSVYDDSLSDDDDDDDGAGQAADVKKCFGESSDLYISKGPYEVGEKPDAGRTFFYPKNLRSGCKYPGVVWANGAGVSGSRVYSHNNKHLASWGFFVVASHNQGAANPQISHSSLDALKSGEFEQHLNGKYGSTGHSMGGGGAVNTADRKDVAALVSVQTCAGIRGNGYSKPGLYITGTRDSCLGSTKAAYRSHKAEGFFASYKGGDHMSTPTLGGVMTRAPGNKEYPAIAVAWFRCYLVSSKSDCELFEGGASAPISKQGDWQDIESKNID